MLPLTIVLVLASFSTLSRAQEVGTSRLKAQDAPESNGRVIDNIFNIPITALRQTAVVAQSVNPDKTQAIDDIFKIPISTLEAVGDLVKSTSSQRRSPEEIQQLRQERRERVLAQRERQRLQREEIQNKRFQEKQLKKLIKRYHKDPLGVNALSDLLVGHHGILGGHGHHGLNLLGSHSGHNFASGSQGILSGIHSSASSGGHGSGPNRPNRPSHTYEVHETVDEEGSSIWQGVSAGIASFTGSRPTRPDKIQNKIAPKEGAPPKTNYTYDDEKIQNKIAPISTRRTVTFESDAPLEHRRAPNSNRVVFP